MLVVLRHAQDETGNVAMGRRTSRLPHGFRSPALADQVTVPAKNRPGRDDQPQPAVASPRDHRQQGREQRPIGPGQPRPGRSLALGRRSDAAAAGSQPLSTTRSVGTVATTPGAGPRVRTRTSSTQKEIIHGNDYEPQAHRTTPPRPARTSIRHPQVAVAFTVALLIDVRKSD
jgi:hypothetical protein